MTREEAWRRTKGCLYDVLSGEEADEIIKALEQQPCETIKELPKGYKYDTETEDFLVYRHMYTGHEIHIEKPVPRYKLEQESCGDCISRKAATDRFDLVQSDDLRMSYDDIMAFLSSLPSVEPERKKGHWIMQNDRSKKLLGWSFCSECNAWIGEPTDYCSNCGADMREVDG